ncbi:hypothetical protein GCM10010433_55090 [Streptomyces pulveraceus]
MTVLAAAATGTPTESAMVGSSGETRKVSVPIRNSSRYTPVYVAHGTRAGGDWAGGASSAAGGVDSGTAFLSPDGV